MAWTVMIPITPKVDGDILKFPLKTEDPLKFPLKTEDPRISYEHMSNILQTVSRPIARYQTVYI